MDALAPIRAIDRYQRSHRVLALPVAVVKKFGDDRGSDLAALIAYYGFFAIFPLLLLFVSILGYVLEGDPEAQQAVIDSALKQIPIVGEDLKAGSIHGSGVALVIGVVGTLLAGLGVTVATQTAFNRVHGVPRSARPGFAATRLRGLGMLVVLGTLQILSTVAVGLVAGGLGGPLLVIAGIVISLALNLVLFAAAFRLLTDSSVPTHELRPGIVAATVMWTVVQSVGGAYIGHVVKGAGATYGTFATVIGLLTWLFLGGRVVVYAAELNSVLAQGMWPRALLAPLEEADRLALARRDRNAAFVAEEHASNAGAAGDATDERLPARESG